MSRLILLDTGPLGMYANSGGSRRNALCRERVDELLIAGVEVRAPGIAVYETRRKLCHLDLKTPPASRVARFDQVVSVLGLLPITDEVMGRASEIWGEARSKGITTAPAEAFDGDIILVAHAAIETTKGSSVEIATTNTNDLQALLCLGHFAGCINWDDLKK